MIKHVFAALIALALAAVPALSADLGASTWSEVDASNNAASPNGWTSGSMLPSQVEPTARAMMGAIKRFYDHITPTHFAGGTPNALTLTYAAPMAAYANECFRFYPIAPNTGSATLNVDGLGAKTITVGGAPLIGGELATSNIVTVCYNGTGMQLLGNENDYTPWTSYTPTLACGSGSLTALAYSTGQYKMIGKTVFVRMQIGITTNGSCGTSLIVGLPTGTIEDGSLVNTGTFVGHMLGGGALIGDCCAPGSANVEVYKYDDTYPVGGLGATITLQGVYEAS